jgi:hypothetical protein
MLLFLPFFALTQLIGDPCNIEPAACAIAAKFMAEPAPPPTVREAPIAAAPKPAVYTPVEPIPQPRFSTTPPVQVVPLPPAPPQERYWITLSNEPGVRVLGRIENGYAVDIVRRERFATSVTPSVYAAPSRCLNGRCPSR